MDIRLPSELTGHCVLCINVNKCHLMRDTCSLLVCVLILFEESDIGFRRRVDYVYISSITFFDLHVLEAALVVLREVPVVN